MCYKIFSQLNRRHSIVKQPWPDESKDAIPRTRFQSASFVRKRESSSTSVLGMSSAMAQDPGQTEHSKHRPKLLLENAYRLESAVKFEFDKVKYIIESVLESQLKDESYASKSSEQMVLTVSEIIKNRVKKLNYQSYKIVCLVTIGELNDQGFTMGSRCSWRKNWDSKNYFATGKYVNKTLFAIGSVWGVYLE